MKQDGNDIPISLIYEVANKFGVDFAEIVTGIPCPAGQLPHRAPRPGPGGQPEPGIPLSRTWPTGTTGKVMQPLLVTLEPTDKRRPG
jgi:hypothetical protein